ncbi:hypothetical protein [Kitasatospora viridis]|uniref:Uncharacterized protein n=1 Tax=Kitasatospora viridis TaxID=281105 RepID=A0A561SER0_9ACTN|nr:hypothetical protein [Kitasatospora viridis]TWF73355.1 hypothetical protein FHX73_16506 [Kitasatospora viridis]
MPLSATRRTPAVRTLAGTVLTAALLVPAATACSSTSGSHGAAAPSAAVSVAPAGSPLPASSLPASSLPASSLPADTASAAAPGRPTGSPATRSPTAAPGTPAANRTAPPSGTGKGASPAGTQPLPDGSTAQIQQLGELHYLAKIVHDGQVYGTVEANGHDAGVDANDMFVVLAMDGTVHAWMGGAQQGPGTFQLAGGWTAEVTKVGDLHYRAKILGGDGSVDGTLDADQHDAGLDANGVYLVLGVGGEISAHE